MPEPSSIPLPLHRAATNVVHIEIVIYEQHISLSMSMHTANLSNKIISEPIKKTVNHFQVSSFHGGALALMLLKLNVRFWSCEAHNA